MKKNIFYQTCLSVLLFVFLSACQQAKENEITPTLTKTNKDRQARMAEEESGGVVLKSTYFIRVNGVKYFSGQKIYVRYGDILEMYHRRYYTEETRLQDRSGPADTNAWYPIPSGLTVIAHNNTGGNSFNDYRKFRVDDASPFGLGHLKVSHVYDPYDSESVIVDVLIVPNESY